MAIPKLDGGEAIALTFGTLLGQLAFLLVSFVALVAADALIAGNGIATLATGSWANPVFSSLRAQPPLATFGAACAAGLVMFLYAAWSEKRGLRNESARRSIMASRQGIAGEMPRLPFPLIVVLMAIVGFSEELLFRFLLLGALLSLLSPLCGFALAAVISIAASSVVFCLAHALNGESGPVVTRLLLGVVMGAAFVLTQSLAVAAAAHALYNIAVLASARAKMRRDPDYFGGPAPTKAFIGSEDE